MQTLRRPSRISAFRPGLNPEAAVPQDHRRLLGRRKVCIALPNVRAKLAPTVGRAGPVGENVQRTADRARVARRWGSA